LSKGVSYEEKVFSPSIARKFHEIAYEKIEAENLSPEELQAGLLLLNAASDLEPKNRYLYPDMIKLAARFSKQDASNFIFQILINYVDDSTDLEVASEAVRYLLDRSDTRERRKEVIEMLLLNTDKRNAVFSSELKTLLGLLSAEKSDIKSATTYFQESYEANKYNKLAFRKLAEIAPEKITPTQYLEHLRYALSENPLNMEAALSFAQYAGSLGLYQAACDSYEYCSDLFAYLQPHQPLPAYIYHPWIINSYNTLRSQYKCIQIVKKIRESGRFDLIAEAIVSKAALRIGDMKEAKRALQSIEKRANKLLINEGVSTEGSVSAKQLAWFYNFAYPDRDKALDWSNKAFSLEPNSPEAASILAYSLANMGQGRLAESLIENYAQTQISDMAKALIQKERGKDNTAIETLKRAISKDASSLEAERAKEILAQLGGEYITPVTAETTLQALESDFGPRLVPRFNKPEDIISIQLSFRGNKFSYRRDFGGTIAIINNGSEPLVISDDGMFTGKIRIDANVSGDLNMNIPNHVSMRIRPALPIEPGRTLIIPLKLTTGKLKEILEVYPQASLDIEFTAYIDAVEYGQGMLGNRLGSIAPIKVGISRPGKVLTTKYLQNRLNTISKGQKGQKIEIAELFVGLLLEQRAMANSEPMYNYMYADWMPDLLKSALTRSLSDDDWVSKIHIMAALLNTPLDYELINAVSPNLNDEHWPTRVMAMMLLAKNQDENFSNVLDWTAKQDSNNFVRRMAITLGGAIPEPEYMPEPMPPSNQEEKQFQRRTY